MIVRILGEGQLDVAEDHLAELNELDAGLSEAVTAGDEQRFQHALSTLLDRVRAAGTPVADDSLSVSDVILPAQESSLAEVRALLGEEGLIPG
ncbi:hypothetical protein CJ179_48420 [Rhodococcus sp. ACS1]|uniref:PspA-associated domain-containing protein n=1 Tax=Rhodococcus pseudokoreensis TaxID=2811421 RepID=A0A974ZRP2_9NOCA|nr:MULTISPECIES: hypothetical protein [Rhodococcus]MBV6761461.1 hypothetical protein [Rhodococcus opacus]MDI9938945.1 hypothetical protein [Rhodococcus sp. IEGM 1351]PBC35423.1 hypothetical protein CJ179_48420 [Rhodococcus sp. ACS1]QSE87729.1 hypothetical protein JWS13_03560 [Rhodococcus pseudokoreensis]